MLDIIIVGAGPYGLSLASCLKTMNVRFRIFGKPMHVWKTQMPRGMFLKSDSCSTDFINPQGAMLWRDFLMEKDGTFDKDAAIPLDRFIDYGMEYQARLVPELEQLDVVSVEKDGEGYLVKLSNQEMVQTRRVVIAIGVDAFRWMPPVLNTLPTDKCTHSAEYGSVDHFRGKKVAVIGSGASAIDLSLSLVAVGAEPTVISRRPEITFQPPPAKKKHSLLFRMRKPNTGIGRGWLMKLYAEAPQVFHMLPAPVRAYILKNTLGAQPGWVAKQMMDGRVTVLTKRHTVAATVENGKVKMTLRRARDNSKHVLEVDHVVGATGYRTNVQNLKFLDKTIRDQIATYKGAPKLSRWFETTCSGIYFIGPSTGNSFGPIMRFVFGASFTMKSMMKHFSKLYETKAELQSAPATSTNA